MKMKLIMTFSLIVVLGAFLSMAGSIQQADDPGVLLRAAIEKEEVDGNLQEAVDLYKQIIAKYGGNYTIAAKAQLRIGMCYEKLGLHEAQNAYQKVIENYPQQQEEVKLAKERISHLAKALAAAPGKPKFRKIRIPANPGNGVLSPDGKKLAFASDGSIWVVPIPGKVDPNIVGTPVRLTEAMGADSQLNTLAWSGDGNWIAFNGSPDGIYLVPVTGGEVKRLPVEPVGRNYYRRLSLSRNGKILAYADNEGVHTLYLEEGKEELLAESPAGDPAFSPDGKRLVYMKTTPIENGYVNDIYVTDLVDGVPVKINSINGRVQGPVWSPDGTMVSFIHDPLQVDQEMDVCILPVKKTDSSSMNPLRIKLPLPTYHYPAGWTQKNSIGMHLGSRLNAAIYTVPSSGGIASQVSPVGLANHPRWSRDGKRIFYRGTGAAIVSIPSEGGQVTTILPENPFSDEVWYEATSGGGNNVSPDGKKLVFSGVRSIGKRGEKGYHIEVRIYTIPVEGGKPTQITDYSWDPNDKLGGQDRYPCWSPDGKRIAFIRDHKNEEGKYLISIFGVPSDGGESQQLTTESHNVAWAPIDWSPDGEHIAYFSQDKFINLFSVESGNIRTVVKVDGINGHWELSWSPDGKKLAYSNKGKIYTIPIEGGKPIGVKTGLDAEASNLSWSPDGTKIAFAATKRDPAELYLMEDFLHLVKRK
jgi:Tol biopolymer transport system component